MPKRLTKDVERAALSKKVNREGCGAAHPRLTRIAFVLETADGHQGKGFFF